MHSGSGNQIMSSCKCHLADVDVFFLVIGFNRLMCVLCVGIFVGHLMNEVYCFHSLDPQ